MRSCFLREKSLHRLSTRAVSGNEQDGGAQHPLFQSRIGRRSETIHAKILSFIFLRLFTMGEEQKASRFLMFTRYV